MEKSKENQRDTLNILLLIFYKLYLYIIIKYTEKSILDFSQYRTKSRSEFWHTRSETTITSTITIHRIGSTIRDKRNLKW